MTPVIGRMRLLLVIVACSACTDWDHTQSGGQVCTAWMGWNDPTPTQCSREAPPRQTCTSRPLGAGTYTILFEKDRLELAIPSTASDGGLAECLERPLE